MTRSIPALTARTQFGQILDRVTTDKERFVITKKGEPKAIIVSVEDFLKATGEKAISLTPTQETTGNALLRLANLGKRLQLKGPADLSSKIDEYLYGEDQ